MKNEWKIRFEKDDPKGREMIIGKQFRWNCVQGHIPAAYLCDEGLILDICMEYDREIYSSYLDCYRQIFGRQKNGGKINRNQLTQFQQDDPMDCFFQTELLVNGKKLRHYEGHGMRWVPKDLEPIISDDLDMQPVMEHYRLAQDKVWQFRREAYLWDEPKDQKLEDWELRLIQWPQMHVSQTFNMPKIGDRVTVSNPLTGCEHLITVTEIQQKKVRKLHHDNLIFPENCIIMEYTLEPEVPQNMFFLRDTAEPDEPVQKENGSVIGGAVTVLASDSSRPEGRYAVSSLHFQPVENVTWQAVFRVKTVDDMVLKLM